MTALDRILPTPRLLETDGVDLAVPPSVAWELVRHGDLGASPIVHALFAIRTLPGRLAGRAPGPLRLRVDDPASSPGKPGFQILADDPPHEVVVGAIGKVWQTDIPFVHVADASAYAGFSDEGWVKVAWALRVTPLGERDSHVEFEVRVDARDEASWRKFVAYFRLIGPGSHFVRRTLLHALARDHGTPESMQYIRPLAGDELLPDALAQVTHGVTIAATPEAHLAMARPDGVPSRRVLRDRRSGQRRPAERTGDSPDLGRDPGRRRRAGDTRRQRRVRSPAGARGARARPRRPLRSPRAASACLRIAPSPELLADHLGVRPRAARCREDVPACTRTRRVLEARALARGMDSPGSSLHAERAAPSLAARVEGRLPPDDWRDVAEGSAAPR